MEVWGLEAPSREGVLSTTGFGAEPHACSGITTGSA